MHTVIQGDSLAVLRDWPSSFFDCCVTSPPYWGLRDYGTPPVIWDAREGCEHHWGNGIDAPCARPGEKSPQEYGAKEIIGNRGDYQKSAFCSLCGAWRGSLGLEPDFRDYLRHLMQIMEQVGRVLKPTGTCWVNLGDSYVGGKGQNGSSKARRTAEERGYVQSGGTVMMDTRPADLPQLARPKSLCAIPDRFKIAMIDAGWVCRNEIIWYKRNCMPSSAKDRFTVDFEKVYFFTKQGKYYFKQQLEPMAQSTIRRVELAESREEVEAEIKAPVTNSYKRCDSAAVSRNMYSDERDHLVCAPSEGGRNRRCVWDITTKPSSEPHFAMFPDTLVEPMLSAGCPTGGVVLDPFSGMGTVGLVAERLGMDFIGIELNGEYAEKSEIRLVVGK